MKKRSPISFQIRPARKRDVPTLVRIETICFASDQLSRQSFDHFVTSRSAEMFVAVVELRVVGYFVLLYHQGTSLARLYSLAVLPEYRRRGIGTALMKQAEYLCLEERKHTVRLEVRKDNRCGIGLYQKLKYRPYRIRHGYYEDYADAICLEKAILPSSIVTKRYLTYYAQSLNFTCGPACLLMAMSAFDPRMKASLGEELAIWREATTIFMTSGHGGCGPLGLAIAAHRRGFASEVWTNVEGPLFAAGVRAKSKKEVLQIVYEQFKKESRRRKIPTRKRQFQVADLERFVQEGALALVMISSYKIARMKAPHWVLVVGVDRDFFYIHDPEIDPADKKFLPDVSFIPVRKNDFIKMGRYGQRKAQVAVILRGKLPRPQVG